MAGTITSTTTRHRARGLVRLNAHLVCDASGDASATVIGAAYGRIVGVAYKPGTLATGADVTVKDASTAAAILTLTDAGTSNRFFRPTAVPTANTGVAVTPAAGLLGTFDIFVAGKLTVTVAQGGNLGAGDIALIVDEGQPVGSTDA
jgi:hypothetical protein